MMTFVENYFNYLTDIEEHFCRRRGAGLQLSPLDWVLMETWKDAGIPLEAVLRGIDATFDHYHRRPPKAKIKKINGLAWCTQEILAAAAEMKEAAAGSHRAPAKGVPGLGHREIADFLLRNSAMLHEIHSQNLPEPLGYALAQSAASLMELGELEQSKSALPSSSQTSSQLDELERTLTVLEEKLLAALMVATSETDLIQLRAEADREIAPYRNKMPGFQMEQLRKQFVHKKLFEKAKIPRLSLFYL
jgi:hypothetical protein